MSGLLRAIAWKTKPRQPMLTAEQSMVTPEHGVAGDFRGASGLRQITVLFEDDWQAACEAVGETLPWTLRRANFLIMGLSNPRASGGQLRIGAATFAITGETEPCSNMDRQHNGLRAALTPDWRGGLTAQVIVGGLVTVGDKANWF